MGPRALIEDLQRVAWKDRKVTIVFDSDVRDKPEIEWARWQLVRVLGEHGGPPATTLAELVRVAGVRWSIEDLFELAKGDCRLDQYEVRSWTGWHRHVTLSLFALAVVAVIRSRVAGPAKKGARG